MRFDVNGVAAYAYTGARALVAAQPTVLFVHGAGNDHSVWALQSRYFAHHGRNVLALDLPGHGRSAAPALPDVASLSAWLAAAVEALGIERYALVGHSLGALAALEHAAGHAPRVSALALLGPALPMSVSDALLDAAACDEPRANALITRWSHSPAAQLGGNRVPGMWLTGSAFALLERTPRGVLRTDLAACNAYAGGERAARAVECPVLLVLGGRDLMAPPRQAALLETAVANVTRVLLPHAGHAMMTEEPDAVLDALRDFLARAPATAAAA